MNEKLKLGRFLAPLRKPKVVFGILIVSFVMAAIMAYLDTRFHHLQ